MAPVGSKTISFKIPVNWLWGIVALGVLLIVAFIFIPNPTTWRPVLVFAAAVIAGSAGLITAINNLDQRADLVTKEAQNAAKAAALLAEQAAEMRVQNALAVFDKWNSPHFFHCKKNVRVIVGYFREHQNPDEQIAYLEADPDKYANLFDTLNLFEALEIAIASNTVDDNAAKRFFRSIVREYWHRTEGLIKRLRADRANGRLFCEFEKLYNRWNKPT